MLAGERPDLVGIVVNPPQTHVVARAALARGVSVIMETPVASQLDHADALIALAGANGAHIQVAENL